MFLCENLLRRRDFNFYLYGMLVLGKLCITRVAHGSVARTYMSRAKLFRNPLIDGPGTTFGW